MVGKHQTGVGVVTHRSPISGLIFGAIGRKGVERLSDIIQDIRAKGAARGDSNPFSDHGTVSYFIQQVVEAIGHSNFETIITELKRVARYYIDDPLRGNPIRLLKLESLRRQFV